MVLRLGEDAMEQAENAGKIFAQEQQDLSICWIRGPAVPEKQLNFEEAEHASQGCNAPPLPADVYGEASGGWKRRYGPVDLQASAHCILHDVQKFYSILPRY
jgi:hypothetical protein